MRIITSVTRPECLIAHPGDSHVKVTAIKAQFASVGVVLVVHATLNTAALKNTSEAKNHAQMPPLQRMMQKRVRT